MVMPASNSSKWEVEDRRSGVQGHPCYTESRESIWAAGDLSSENQNNEANK